jgi:hypothetical protein
MSRPARIVPFIVPRTASSAGEDLPPCLQALTMPDLSDLLGGEPNDEHDTNLCATLRALREVFPDADISVSEIPLETSPPSVLNPDRWKGRLPHLGDPPAGIHPDAWSRHHLGVIPPQDPSRCQSGRCIAPAGPSGLCRVCERRRR